MLKLEFISKQFSSSLENLELITQLLRSKSISSKPSSLSFKKSSNSKESFKSKKKELLKRKLTFQFLYQQEIQSQSRTIFHWLFWLKNLFQKSRESNLKIQVFNWTLTKKFNWSSSVSYSVEKLILEKKLHLNSIHTEKLPTPSCSHSENHGQLITKSCSTPSCKKDSLWPTWLNTPILKSKRLKPFLIKDLKVIEF